MNQGSVEHLKMFVLELLKYLNNKDMVQELKDWKCPVPPISGKFLKDHNCPDGKVMGKVRQTLIENWIDSRFRLTEAELAKLIPGILEGLKDMIEEQSKRSGGKRKLSAVKN